MKLYGLSGLATGKKGADVFSIRNGVQIVRQWNPEPYNPKTPSQVESRAKMKLLSQVGAAVKPIIAIQREGLKTPRNLFISKNYDIVSYANNEAQIALQDMQLTNSSIALPAFTAERSGSTIDVALAQDMRGSIDRVVYLVLSCPSNQELIPQGSIVVSTPGADGLFAGQLPDVEGNIVVYGYGIRDNNAASTVKFSDLGVDPGITVAKIVASRTLSSTDFSLTETRGLQLADGESSGETPGTNAVRVTLGFRNNAFDKTAAALTGAGNYEIGSEVTVRYTGEGEFNGWYGSATGTDLVSSANPYTFTASANISLYCSNDQPY